MKIFIAAIDHKPVFMRRDVNSGGCVKSWMYTMYKTMKIKNMNMGKSNFLFFFRMKRMKGLDSRKPVRELCRVVRRSSTIPVMERMDATIMREENMVIPSCT